MTLVGGHRRRVQITSGALVLALAATMGTGRAEAAGAGDPAPPTARDEGGLAAVTFSKDVVRGLQALRKPEPATPEPKSPERPSKVVYLTFDDGPSVRYTKPILDLLDRYGAEATFFQVGENARNHPNLVRAVVAQGHALGSHTWSHRDMRRLNPRRMTHQITRTSRVLHSITGEPVTCLRPPFGAVNRRVRSAVRGQDLSMRLWDVDPRDWKRPGAAVIARRVVARADPGDVILLHDGGGNRSQSVRALGRILRTLSEKGYAFRSLPGC